MRTLGAAMKTQWVGRGRWRACCVCCNSAHCWLLQPHAFVPNSFRPGLTAPPPHLVADLGVGVALLLQGLHGGHHGGDVHTCKMKGKWVGVGGCGLKQPGRRAGNAVATWRTHCDVRRVK